MLRPDYRIYAITAARLDLGRTHEDIAAAAIRGGATVVQLRDKEMDDEEFEAVARRVSLIAKRGGAIFIVNDRPDIAARVKADGVHVGQTDEGMEDIRQRLKAKFIIGVSATDYQEAVRAARLHPDYLGVGPIFPTSSKVDAAPALGVDELARICRDIEVPVVAIGGITAANLKQVIAAGASGAAMIAAIAGAPDMTQATADIKRMWENHDASGGR